jgi:peptidoglycan hydrolase CwlO-like protein
MTTLQQAAQAIHDDVRILFETSSRLEQIQSHFASVQVELDNKQSTIDVLSSRIRELEKRLAEHDGCSRFCITDARLLKKS